ncbi:protein of unknown function [Pseudomonas sp. JV551A1]|uniref:Uncharacterized protein n=1 Tax=Pseudomonas inefficax TaxID=2078786 RepID=A0AAQ1STP8_9PSED|nr:protein of unknown function [Pseudomonas sp. JV551A1]SPO60489.1 protein of unknown function [Pseudomonas inefficax]
MCRDRGAKHPHDSCLKQIIPGAAARPFRDTRPLLQVPDDCNGLYGVALADTRFRCD